MKVQPWLLLLLAASIFGSYATTNAEETQQRQSEVAIGAGVGQQMLKFGAKTPVKSTQETILNLSPNSSYSPRRVSSRNKPPPATANTLTASASVPRMSRRYDSPKAPSAQLITQYDIPIVNKQRNAGDATQKGRQRSRDRAATAPSTVESLQGTHSDLQATAGNLPAPRFTSRDRSTGSVNSNFHSNVNRQVNSSSGSRSTSSNRSKTRKPAASTTTTTTTTSTTTTTTPRPPSFGNFPLSNPFNLFPQSFWNFSNPPPSPRQQFQPTSTKKPPKKYIPTPSPVAIPVASSKEEKLSYLKPKSAIKPTKEVPDPPLPLTTPKKNNHDGPFRIALPTINFFGNQKDDPEKEKEKRATVASLRERFNCPRESEVRFQLFPKICKNDKDCSVWNRDELCCEIFGAKSCVSGLPKPLEETSHAPILGLIPRKCPTRPLAELWWEVKECETDMDCWPRVCCPDGRRRYCRTSQPELETVPVPVKRSFNYLTEYLECTAPPPPIFDLHPKACTSTFDCFPNVCCQEAGLRHCRPPKKSVLTLMANFLNVDFVKRLTQNIVIK